ncbi:hypothetical protein [Paraburkholderia sp. BR10954]|uniref:hypothetical protein n=1 Tax=Paraburkholderia sp. BR10954 TaxID=3236995 RepID=UPI0034D23396
MRWTDEGAHCMVQVRVAVLSGEFSPRRISELKIASSDHGKSNGAQSVGWQWPTDRAERESMGWTVDAWATAQHTVLAREYQKAAEQLRAFLASATLTKPSDVEITVKDSAGTRPAFRLI